MTRSIVTEVSSDLRSQLCTRIRSIPSYVLLYQNIPQARLTLLPLTQEPTLDHTFTGAVHNSYEVLLQEKGIDRDQSIDASQVQHHSRSSRSGIPQHIWRLPTASNDSEPQETLFKPLLLHGQRGTKFVDK
jgi:hypothetical protein